MSTKQLSLVLVALLLLTCVGTAALVLHEPAAEPTASSRKEPRPRRSRGGASRGATQPERAVTEPEESEPRRPTNVPKPARSARSAASVDRSETTAPSTDAPADTARAPKTVRGVVTDAYTGEALAGVRVLYVATTDAKLPETTAADSDAEGRFQVSLSSASERSGRDFEVRFGKSGYRTTTMAPDESELAVVLEPTGAATRPGRITGAYRGPNGEVFDAPGVVQITLLDELGERRRMQALVDAAGEFALEGVAAGSHRVYVEPLQSAEVAEASVSEGGDARIELRTGVAPQPVESLPRLVVGLPADGHLRAESPQRSVWRAPVHGGTARFDHLPAGRWTLVLEVPGEPDLTRRIEVSADDPGDIAWEPAPEETQPE